MNPALHERKARCQPALIGAGPGAEIDDLHNTADATAVDQVFDQLGEEAADGGGTGGAVGGGSGGEPAWLDSGLCWRYR